MILLSAKLWRRRHKIELLLEKPGGPVMHELAETPDRMERAFQQLMNSFQMVFDGGPTTQLGSRMLAKRSCRCIDWTEGVLGIPTAVLAEIAAPTRGTAVVNALRIMVTCVCM